MDPITILSKYYEKDSPALTVLIQHGRLVAQRALCVARKMAHAKPDLTFIEEAAMLHDIAIFMTHAGGIGCNGPYPYVCHGYLGRELLEKEGLPRHALVCERHVGVGIRAAEIQELGLPLPVRDMYPLSLEERIIAYADKFFTKSQGDREKSVARICRGLSKYGPDKTARFLAWVREFEIDILPLDLA